MCRSSGRGDRIDSAPTASQPYHSLMSSSVTESRRSTRMYPSIAQDPSYKGALSQGFAWGFASASYQIEGARADRGDCLWDRFLEGKDNGDIAADSYHLFEEDLKCLKAYGATSYRFSISWPRVIPKGQLTYALTPFPCSAKTQPHDCSRIGGKDDPVNEAGLNYYKHMVGSFLLFCNP